MKKVVYIIHGWDGSPKEPMHLWLKEELKKKRFKVIVPLMPGKSKPRIEKWIDKLNKIIKEPNENTFFIGHSIGCQAILRYLEQLKSDISIGGLVFVAPWMKLDKKTIKEEGEEVMKIAKSWEETPIDWNKVKIHANKVICILSDNDPYVPLSNAELFKENLGAEIIIEHNKGHYTESDNVKENEIALNSLLEL